MVGTLRANCGKKDENGGYGCVVVMQHNESVSESALHGRPADDAHYHKYHVKRISVGQPCSCAQDVQKRSTTKFVAGLTATAQQALAKAPSCFIQEEGVNKSTSLTG